MGAKQIVTIVFGIQGVGKSAVVSSALENFTGDDAFRLLKWGDRTYEIALEKKIIRVGDYKTEGNYLVKYEDVERGVTVVSSGDEGNAEVGGAAGHGGNLIFVKDEGSLQNARDEIRNLNLDTQKMLQVEVSNSYATEIMNNTGTNFLIETHAALKTKQGYLPGLTMEFMQKIKPNLYLIIEANAEEIFARRVNDKGRKRDHDKSVMDVQINLDTTRYFASNFSVNTHSALCIVENKENLANEAVEEITEILKNL
jgi:adenylate kinase